MSDDLTLAMRMTADSRQLVDAARQSQSEIQKMGAQTRSANEELQRLGAQQRQMASAADAARTGWKGNTDALAELDDELSRFLTLTDKSYRAQRMLDQGNDLLSRGLQAGLLSQKQYDSALSSLATRYGPAATGAGELSEQHGKLAGNTGFLTREVSALMHELTSGRERQAMGTLSIIATRVLNIGPLALGAAGAIIGLGAASVMAFTQGEKEAHAMNNALQTTNNYSGMTRGQMRELAAEMERTSTLTIGTSKDIVTQLVASGQLGAQSVRQIALIADNYAASVGKSAGTIGPELAKMFANPTRAAQQLNESMHFLTAEELAYIKAVQDSGRTEEARLMVLDKLRGRLVDQKEQIGAIHSVLNEGWKKWTDWWDAAMGIGRPKTIEDTLKQAREELTKFDAVLATQNAARASIGLPPASPTGREGLQLRVDDAREIQRANNLIAADGAARAAANQRQIEANQVAQQASEYSKIRDIKAQIAKLDELTPVNGEQAADKARALYVLNKQLADVQRGMGAEARQLMEARGQGEINLANIQGRAAAQNIDAQVTLGALTRQQGEERKLQLDLEQIQRQQIFVQQQLANTTLTQVERVRLQSTLQGLKAEGEARQQAYDNQQLIQRQELLRAQADADAQASKATTEAQLKALAGYDDEIEKLRKKNAEIGKTRSQVELLRAEEVRADIARKERDKSTALEDGADSESPYIKRLDAEIEKLREIQRLHGQTSVLEAQKAAIEQSTQDFKTLWSTVEQTGKQAFTYLISQGRNAGESIKQSLKAATIDLLYQLTARRWIINIGTSIAGAMGLNGGNAAAAGNVFMNGGGIGGGLTSVASLPGMGTFGAGQTLADFGNFFGSIGSVTESGATFGMMDAIGGFAAANPYTAAAIAAAALIGGSKLFGGGGGGPASFTGLDVSGTASAGGISGAQFFGNSRNSNEAFKWSSNDVYGGQSVLASLGDVAKSAFDSMSKLARMMDLNTSSLDQAQLPFAFTVTEHAAPQGPNYDEVLRAMQANIGQLTDQMAEKLLPNIRNFAQANETLTQTFTRLAAARRQADIDSIFTKMNAATRLYDETSSLFLSNLSPLNASQRLAYSGSQYSITLAQAQSGDVSAMGRLAGAAQSYLGEARSYYASSQQYTEIFSRVMSQTQGLVADTLAQQSVQFASMGLTLDDISQNTDNLDGRIAIALNAAVGAWQTTDNVLQSQLRAALGDVGVNISTLDASITSELRASIAAPLREQLLQMLTASSTLAQISGNTYNLGGTLSGAAGDIAGSVDTVMSTLSGLDTSVATALQATLSGPMNQQLVQQAASAAALKDIAGDMKTLAADMAAQVAAKLLPALAAQVEATRQSGTTVAAAVTDAKTADQLARESARTSVWIDNITIAYNSDGVATGAYNSDGELLGPGFRVALGITSSSDG